MIDIHSHIIPSIDDGSDSIETSIKMLEIAKQAGTKTIFATPHYYRGRFETEYIEILGQVDELRERVDGICIYPGQEVYIDNYTLQAYDEGIIGTLNNSRYMLMELPFSKISGNELETIYELRIKGIVPIIAHPERYMYIIEKPSNINSFIEEGCLFQINTGSINGLFGRAVKNTADILIQNGLCSFIASDAHNSMERCPGINNSYEHLKKKNICLLENIIKNSELLLNNEEIKSTAVKIKEKKGIFTIFKK